MASRPRPKQNNPGVDVPADRGVFMISVAAELAAMHPQTLRMYETRGLIEPTRSPKGTRLYSQEDVELLRRIQEMTADMGLNLAGVEMVLELESELERMRRRVAALERQAEKVRAQLDQELDRVRRSFRTELVPLATKGALVRRIDVERAFPTPLPRPRDSRL
jgi:MerR family transcriptional regulator/heat shock protein HspR